MRWKPLTPLPVMWYVGVVIYACFVFVAMTPRFFMTVFIIMNIGLLQRPFARRDIARVLATLPFSRKRLGRRLLNRIVIPFLVLYAILGLVYLRKDIDHAILCFMMAVIAVFLAPLGRLLYGHSLLEGRRLFSSFVLTTAVAAWVISVGFLDARLVSRPMFLAVNVSLLALSVLIAAYDLVWGYRHAEVLIDWLRTRTMPQSRILFELFSDLGEYGHLARWWSLSPESESLSMTFIVAAGVICFFIALAGSGMDGTPLFLMGTVACLVSVYRNRTILGSLRYLRGLPMTAGRIVFELVFRPVITHIETVAIMLVFALFTGLTINAVNMAIVLAFTVSLSIAVTMTWLLVGGIAASTLLMFVFLPFFYRPADVPLPLVGAYPLAFAAIVTLYRLIKRSSRVYKPVSIKEEG